MNLDFMNAIILSEDEKKTYDRAISTPLVFKSVDKENVQNVSPLFRLSLIQVAKHQSPKSIKTMYVIKEDYPKELVSVISALNESKDDRYRKELIAMKSILMNRYFNSPDIKETNYEEFMISAGSMLVCVHCSRTNVTIENKSKRSADEPTETFYKCQDCGKEFRERIRFQ